MLKRFAYVLSQFARIYRLPEVGIGYGRPVGPGLWILPDARSSIFERKELVAPADVGMGVWKSTRIPILFGQPDSSTWIVRNGDQTLLSLDVISNAFYFLSGWQEVHSPIRDNMGRYPYVQSLQAALGFAHIPVVNYYFDILRQALEVHTGQEIALREWIDGPFAYFGSHDIDTCETAWLQGSKHALKSGNFRAPFQLLFRKLLGKDAWYNFDEIMDIEQRRGAHSTYFFIARNNRVNGKANADYDVRDAKFKRLFDRIAESGSETGLHGSLGSHHDPVLFSEDKGRLHGSVTGNRFHFLGFDSASTPRLLEDAGIRYDSTLGFAEECGFRNGICHPFFLYDHASEEASKVLEIPLIAMDATFQFSKYMGLSATDSLLKLNQLQAEVSRWKGVMSVLWHNTHFSEYKYAGWRQVYEGSLDAAKQAGAVFLTGQQVHANWIR